jgi:hypothetical protein
MAQARSISLTDSSTAVAVANGCEKEVLEKQHGTIGRIVHPFDGFGVRQGSGGFIRSPSGGFKKIQRNIGSNS